MAAFLLVFYVYRSSKHHLLSYLRITVIVVTTVTPRTSPKKKEDQLKWQSADSQLFACPLHAVLSFLVELFPTATPETRG
jgi:hypothetical protein